MRALCSNLAMQQGRQKNGIGRYGRRHGRLEFWGHMATLRSRPRTQLSLIFLMEVFKLLSTVGSLLI
ncbi:unnamed protein product [Prunus armeniaca]|uniref:Uncharacterized protein n=1 Tax=Prunus armeniaca TaxID=36596 RepID=A0A6J5WLQ3_PRUAR|nr:unnamed protein product [Prunus armeniaca]